MLDLVFYGAAVVVFGIGVKAYMKIKNSIIINKKDWLIVEKRIRENEREKVFNDVQAHK